MFSGLIQEVSKVAFSKKVDSGEVLGILKPRSWNKMKIGESIAVSGVCLSLVKVVKNTLVFERSPQTINTTVLHSEVNLERSLKMGDSLGGHFVLGHVDGVVELVKIEKQGKYQVWTLKMPTKKHGKILIEKGSIAIEGVSLTISKIISKKKFQVCLIPITLAHTNFGDFKEGDFLNFENDHLAKQYIKLGAKL